jgi:hypothetical protein
MSMTDPEDGWRDDQSSTSPTENAGMLNAHRLHLLPFTTVPSLAPLKMAARVFRKIVFSLGALHLTLMAVIGIWFWSSPALFESRQPRLLEHGTAGCASMALLGQHIPLSSSSLRTLSLVIYAFFAVPGLNLIVPATVLLALHIVYHYFRPREDDSTTSVVPVYTGLIFLLVVNVVFMVDIEITISHHDVSDESQWTFGQTLAVLLLVLPLRDVFYFVMRVLKDKRHKERHTRCTQELKAALEEITMEHAKQMKQVKEAVKYADVRVEASGMLAAFHAAYQS